VPIDTSASPARLALARHLAGDGVEIGPSCKPFPLPVGARARYLDRWTPEQSRELFPELAGLDFVAPDVLVDLDAEGLAPLHDSSVDFVVASHLLEHVANPIAVIDEIHRVLRDGGTAIIVLPDRATTFDSSRAPTPLADVIADFRRDIRHVDDEHLLDFLVGAGPGASYLDLPAEAERPGFFDWHRQRSIHVHCWSQGEFWPVIGFGIEALGHRWEHVDGFATDDPAADGIEFGFALRKAALPLAREVRVARWYAAVAAWDAAQPHHLAQRLADACRDAEALRASTSWRVTAPLRRGTDTARALRNLTLDKIRSRTRRSN
jgi:SAM-dependent methyltransferase